MMLVRVNLQKNVDQWRGQSYLFVIYVNGVSTHLHLKLYISLSQNLDQLRTILKVDVVWKYFRIEKSIKNTDLAFTVVSITHAERRELGLVQIKFWTLFRDPWAHNKIFLCPPSFTPPPFKLANCFICLAVWTALLRWLYENQRLFYFNLCFDPCTAWTSIPEYT